MKKSIFFIVVVLMPVFLFSECFISNIKDSFSFGSQNSTLRRVGEVSSLAQITGNGYAVFSQDLHSPNLKVKFFFQG